MKAQDAKKDKKKAPQKTAKEKKLAKQEMHPLNPNRTDGLNKWALITNFLSIQ